MQYEFFFSRGNLKKTEFDVTVPMSNYLMAVVISDFTCLHKTVDDAGAYGKIDLSMCGRPTALQQLEYSLNVSANVIKFYETFFDTKYPLKKLGMKIL